MGFKKCRIRAGLTVSKAADSLGVSQEAVFSWERGKYVPEGRRLPEIAKLYNSTVDDLLRDDDKE